MATGSAPLAFFSVPQAPLLASSPATRSEKTTSSDQISTLHLHIRHGRCVIDMDILSWRTLAYQHILAHHPHILMLQNMTVEHVRVVRVRVVGETHNQPHILTNRHINRILPASFTRSRQLPVTAQDLELHPM